MVGAGLAIVLYLYRTMSPRVAILGRYHDGTLRDAKVNNLPASDVVTAVRFDGRLYFANVSYFEDAILEAVADNPKAPYLLIVGDGINELDASGEEVIHHLVERLHGSGVTVLFSGLKKQVLDVMHATGLLRLHRPDEHSSPRRTRPSSRSIRARRTSACRCAAPQSAAGFVPAAGHE